MPITKEQILYGFTARWNDDGIFQGAHVEYREVVKEDGAVIASKYLPARAVGDAGEPFGPIFDALNTASLAAIEAKDAEIAALKADVEAKKAEAATATAALDSANAATAAVQAELTALQDSLKPMDANGVPLRVSFRQAKTYLQLAGLWDAAIAAAQAITDPTTKIVTLGLLLDSTEYERNRPELVGFAKSALHLTDAQIDQMFIDAAKL